MKRYINTEIRTSDGFRIKETIDELNSYDFQGTREFIKELSNLFQKHKLAYQNTRYKVYVSQRATKEWRNK